MQIEYGEKVEKKWELNEDVTVPFVPIKFLYVELVNNV